MAEVRRPRLFVLHARADEEWMDGVLRPRLGSIDVVTRHDFTPGEPLLREIERTIVSCEATLAVITENFLIDQLARTAETLAAYLAYLVERSRFVVLLRDDSEIPAYLSSRVILDARDEPQLQEQLDRLVGSLGSAVVEREPTPPCPYPGMVPFASADAARFFGRDAEVSALVSRLDAGAPFTAVIGPSGSGKSSLLSAGLVPKLGGGWSVQEMRPAAAATFAFAEAAESTPAGTQLLWIIDQFEETFTSLKNRQHLFEAVQNARSHPRCKVLIALRVDFLGDLMGSPLWPVLPEQRLEIAPLVGEALRAAIRKPAHQTGVIVAADLIERLMADARHQSGSLPFLQETLRSLWEAAVGVRGDRLLRVTDYDALSRDGRTGLELAVAAKADAALARLPTESRFDATRQRAIVQRTLIRLIQLDGGRPTRRQQHWEDDLRNAGDDPDEFDATLRYLADQRLITTGENRSVDLAHEALISGWKTLRNWIAAAESAEQVRRYYEASAENWQRLGRGEDGLLDPGEIAELERWRSGKAGLEVGVTPLLDELVKSSRAHLQQQRDREVEKARQRTRSRERLLAILGTVLAGALLSLAAVVVLYYSLKRQQNLILVQRLVDLSRNSLPDDHAFDERAALYARQAYLLNRELKGPYEGLTYEAMRRVLYDRDFVRPLRPPPGSHMVVDGLAMSARGKWAAVYDNDDNSVYYDAAGLEVFDYDSRVIGWDLDTSATAGPWATKLALSRRTNPKVVVADDGTAALLAAPCTIHIVDLRQATARAPITIGDAQCSDVAIAPSGTEVAVNTKEGVRRIPLRQGGELQPLTHAEPVLALAYFPDGSRMATVSARSVRIWSLSDAKEIQSVPPAVQGPDWQPSRLQISADGATLNFRTGYRRASASLNDKAPVVSTKADDVSSLIVPGGNILRKDADLHWSSVESAVFNLTSSLYHLRLPLQAQSIPDDSYDGFIVVASGGKRMMWMRSNLSRSIARWNPLADKVPEIVARGYDAICSPAEDGVWALKEADGQVQAVRIDSRGAAVRSVDLPAETVTCKTAAAVDVLALSMRSARQRFLNVTDLTPKALKLPDCYPFAFSPQANRFACADGAKSLLWWNLGAGDGPRTLQSTELKDLKFSADSRLLAGMHDEMITLFELDTTAKPRPLRGHIAELTDIAFSPDGSRLASGSLDHTIRLWPLEPDRDIWAIPAGGEPRDLTFLDDEHLFWRGDHLYVLDLNAGRMADQICQAVSRNLTEAEWRTAFPKRDRDATCPHLPLP